MKKISVSIHTIFYLVIFLSCKSSDHNNIDLSSKAEIISLTDSNKTVGKSKDIFTNLKIIPLKFKDSTLISGVTKMAIDNNSYYIFDNRFTTLYRFDTSGNFLNKIGKLGAEANNYRSLEDFFIDSLNRVILLSNSDQAIFYFTPDDKFLKLKHIGFYNSEFCMLSLNKFFYYLAYNDNKKSGSYNFLLADSSGNIKKRYLLFDKKKSNMSISFSGFLATDGREVYCTDAFNDTIYALGKDDKLTFKYYVDFGEYSLRKERVNHKLLINSRRISQKNTAYLGNQATFNTNYLIFSYVYQNKKNYCIYNKVTKSILRINKSAEDGLLKLLNCPLLITENSKCYFAVSPEDAIRIRENQKLFETLRFDWPILYKFLEQFSANDNYFLISMDFKK